MARVGREKIERIKREVSLERLIEASGIELKRHGAKDRIGRCPFHEDRTPSFVVTPAKNEWHCLGACNEGGDVIRWVMKTRGVSFTHAIALLKADHPSLAARLDHVVRKGATDAVKLEPPVEAAAEDGELLRQAVAYYHETLKQSPEALRYLESRGLADPELIERFKLGFANRTLGYRLPEKNRKSGAEIRGRLGRLGILRKSGHEHFNGSLVIPVFDREGNVQGLYGRKINEYLREGTPLHLYLPGPRKGVWNEEALQASKEIIVCEALIDALTFWTAGFRNVTSSYGVNGFTEDHRRAFQTHGVKNVWIAYDRDEAGDRAAERLKEELRGLGIGSHRVLFPKGMDANEYALKVKPARQSLAVVLNQAEWWEKNRTAAETQAEKRAEKRAENREKTEEKIAVDAPAESSVEASGGASGEVSGGAASARPDEPVPEPAIALAAGSGIEVRNGELVLWREDRKYRVRGLEKNTGLEVLKVNVLVSRQDGFHADTFDIEQDRPRAAFIKRAAEELGVNEDVIRKDVGRLFLALEQHQTEAVRKALEPQKPEARMTGAERAEAFALLKDPDLIGRILADFERAGLVGEETNKLVGYLAAVSRRLESPLAVVVQSSSASGKSSLMDAVLDMMPEEDRIQYSAMTGQSLFYMGQTDLKHKILAIVEEEGASRASYALKLLQSEGALSIASTGKDPATGKHVTHEYRVEGPVMLFLTTTAADIDEELLNRCLVLSVNEDRAQTQAIHRRQRERETLEGVMRREERRRILGLHQNAQRLLEPLTVVNPYAAELTFPDAMMRHRRDHVKYLTLIRAIALLHQHQRPRRTAPCGEGTLTYIEAAPGDIALANRLVEEVLGRSLDELPPQTRRLLGLVDEAVKRETAEHQVGRADYRFSRKHVRAWTAWTDSTLKRHLARLEDMEYLVVHRGGRGQSLVYELAYESGPDPSKPRLPGLIHVYDSKKSVVNDNKSASSPAQVRGVSGGSPLDEARASTAPNGAFIENRGKRIDPGAGDAAHPS